MARSSKTQAQIGFKSDVIFGGRRSEELEFLPSAVEVIERPASPIARLTALSMMGLLIAALAWAGLSKVDIISTAQGKLVPIGGGKLVQPLETGRVSNIAVQDGQIVRKGDVLVRLEPTEPSADRTRLEAELAAAQLDEARTKAVAFGEQFQAPAGAKGAAAQVAEREAHFEGSAIAASLDELDAQVVRHRSELASAEAEIDRLQTLLPLARRRTEAFAELARRGYGAGLREVEAKEKEEDVAKSLEVQRRKIAGLRAQIVETQQLRVHTEAEARKSALSALADARVKATAVKQELEKASARLDAKTIVAPSDGAVQELAIHTVGGVVGAGQTLMKISPSGVKLLAETKLANREVAFVREGMPAQLKIESFPFTKYGVLKGHILSVSKDAVSNDEAERSPATKASAEKQSYTVLLSVDEQFVKVDGRMIALMPGMMVSAEIKTGQRRVIEFLLSPIAKAVSESGHER